jgi:hypothetical protein
MNAVQPFTQLNIPATCNLTECIEVTITGFREGATYCLQARYEFPREVPNYELHWLTKEGRFRAEGLSGYDLQVVR